jgi:putative DNA primase/helicase
LIADLVERASKKVRDRSSKESRPGRNGNGATSNPAAVAQYIKAAVEAETSKVAAAPEGERNCTTWKAACAIGSLVATGAVDRAEAEEKLVEATTLPIEEAVDTIRRGLDKGMECPRDLSHVGRNGDVQGPEPNEAVDDPHRLARLYRDERCLHTDGTPTVQYWQGGFLKWEGAYRLVKDHEIHAELAQCCKREFDRLNQEAIAAWMDAGQCDAKGNPCPPPVARKVTKTLVTNVTLALGGYSLLDGRTENPAWLIENPPFPALEVLPTRNYLVHLPGWAHGDGVAALREPHPNFFGLHALNYGFDPAADRPLEWLRFLGEEPITKTSRVQHAIWPDDPASRETLGEWMGNLLTPDTSHQKILMLIGPRRSGKGTIARIIAALVGPENTCNPTLSSLGTQFGLAPLIGRLAAIITDARLSGRTDLAQVVENLLSVSGEDRKTIDIKYQPPMSLKLNTRFTLIGNEVPRIRDASGALASRMILLKLTESFLGREDPTLTDHLLKELPGILLWAIEGWKRLKERGYFVQPASGQDDVVLMEDLGSPVGAFVRESCKVGPAYAIAVSDLYHAWRDWCTSKGRDQPGDEHSFGRDLKAAVPGITTTRPRANESRKRHYQGIALALAPPPAQNETVTDEPPF